MQLKVPYILPKIQITKEQYEIVLKLEHEIEEFDLWKEEKAVVALCLASKYLRRSELSKRTACEMLRQCMDLGSGV